MLIHVFRVQQQHHEDTANENEEEGNPAAASTELSILERDLCKQNFQFYDKAKQGYVERFELPMLLTSKLLKRHTHNFFLQLAVTIYLIIESSNSTNFWTIRTLRK